MKIGILTFHSQLNYGGVLQCWALQTTLEKLGHKVVVIDRWLDEGNHPLERGFDKFGARQWIKFAIRSLFGLGDFQWWLRIVRTKKFISDNLHLTPYHFVEWKDAPADLGVDYLIVGSDQVWHCGNFGDPRVYLLENGPAIPAIAYAASFGMVGLPHFLSDHGGALLGIAAEPIYRRGLQKFKAVSCREAEGVELCRKLGVEAAHVVDPTVLAFWNTASCNAKMQNGDCQTARKDLVCYFLSEKLHEHFKVLESFARRHKCQVKVFMHAGHFLPLPKNTQAARKWGKGVFKRGFSRVCIMDSAGPKEFFDAFKNAHWVISDSFHALMFSICNGCDVRMVRPSSEFRRAMFARIKEFAKHADGPLVVDSVLAALESISNYGTIGFDRDWIEDRRRKSIEWLEDNLK